MKISDSVAAAINTQINNELTSSYLYLSMSAWFETQPYPGFAQWMLKQSEEERVHAMKFFGYLNDRGGVVSLEAIAQPQPTFSKPLEAFKLALQSEEKTTNQIHHIYEVADEAKDYETRHFLSWFLQEQVEEEKTASDWVQKLTLAGEHVNALFNLDHDAATRQDI
ncbi:ferritin [Cerasicoccus arenae]|uniref:Ferritin n=1 Tax=Cerasicoccus arenae TaxID=424488 RepID=A0A8J3DCY7_9BACT|nr:ferritin [Cerasicoccus arenae]MBK1856871.1 ferritin [Cerasicoccus arenae]GHC11410.1 ferritin [Cerasicoccus arenae]